MILGNIVLTLNPTFEDPWEFAYHFMPRLTLIIFIEVFAYFFLQLYKSSLSEIKYFQNELTNIELKFLALRSAINIEDADSLNEVISALASTERNHVLEKGQTTVELEKVKMEKNALTDATKNLANLFLKKS